MMSRTACRKAGTIFLAMIIPSSGYILLNRPYRGMIMIAWMLVMGFITYELTGDSISFIGKYSGGFAVWALSVIEVHAMLYKKAGDFNRQP